MLKAAQTVDFFRVQSFCLRAIGITRRETGADSALYAFSFFTVLVMKLGTVLFAAKHIDEIMLLCDCLGPTCTAYLGLVRQYNLRLHRTAIWGIVDELDALKRTLQPNEVRIVRRYNRIDRFLAWAYLITAMSTGVLFVGAALVLVVLSEQADWKLPLLMDFPLDMKHPVTFTIFFVWCSVAIFWVVLDCVACDATFGTFSSCLVAHFAIIQHRFENLQFDTAGNGQLGMLIEYHKHILHLADRVIGAYKHVILNQLLISSILLCMLGFQLVISAGTTIMVVYVAYGTAITIQVTYYCYYGSQLYHESTLVHDAVYKSNWYEADVRTQKMLINCMMRANKPVNAKSGFTEASLPTLKAILNSAGSYVALLMSLME
ncbi:odorant receptor 82a-like [Anopheles marshallii]|uniref:odorant receptor 82a-like n=1 Tax=Anopheles marshallii TaxID=1521116 RepID=UPI00237A3CAB|nr:odorant receptor 82a-like [Anopheles marshallii]